MPPTGPMFPPNTRHARADLRIRGVLGSLLFVGLLGGWAALRLPQASPGALLATAPAPTPSEDQVNAVARQLYCPVCANVPLDVCPTQACEQWRATIREELARGWTPQQIQDYFAQQYGERVLASPPARGLNLLVYVLPPLAFLAGAYLLYRAVRGWRRGPMASESGPPRIPAQDEYAQRLEDQLRRRG